MKKDKRPVKIWTCDTETRGLFGEIFRVGLYDGEQYLVFNNFAGVMETLKAYQGYQNHVYFHNLEFDLAKAAPEILDDGGIDFANSIFINNSVVTCATAYFVLHDSYKLLPSSLERLCKDFELADLGKKDLTQHLQENGYKDKGDYFMRVDPEEEMLNIYLQYDCISLYTILEKVMEIGEIDAEKLIFCPTTASLAMTIYRTNHPDEFAAATRYQYNGEFARFLEDYIRLAYYGGRTEVFKPYIKEGFHYDINSLYPYVMKTYTFPVGFPEHFEGVKAEQYFKMWKKRRIGAGFLYCDIFVPDMHIPPLPKRDKAGKLLFPVGRLTGVWTFIEIEKALEMGCTLEKVYSCVYFEKTAELFKDFITHFEYIKTHSTGAKRAFSKLIQNSLYGKFGMNRRRITYVGMDELPKVEEKMQPYILHNYNYNLQGIQFIETMTESRAAYIQPQIAAYITAHARLILLDGLLQQQKNGDVAYCDTDSVAATCTLPDDYIHDKDYGKWKLENVITEGIFLQPKLYAERGSEDTIRAKGIPKEILAGITYNDYVDWYHIMREQEKEVINIFNDYKTRMKFITMLKCNMDLNAVNFISKSIHVMAMQKRDIDYTNNITRPHTIAEYGDVLADCFIHNSKYTKLLEAMDDDIEDVLELIEIYGKIKPVQNDSRLYPLYAKLSKYTINKCFSHGGTDIYDWCAQTGYKVKELLEDMEYL